MVYAHHYGKCYWCDRPQQLGTDIFAWAPGQKRKVNIPKASIISPISPQIKPAPKVSKPLTVSTRPTSSFLGLPVVPYRYIIARVSATGQVTPYEANSPAGKYTETRLILPAGAVPLEMVAIPGGTFMMGSPESEVDRIASEGPQHKVRVPDFLMGRYTVTQAQYEAVMGNNPAGFKGDNNPLFPF